MTRRQPPPDRAQPASVKQPQHVRVLGSTGDGETGEAGDVREAGEVERASSGNGATQSGRSTAAKRSPGAERSTAAKRSAGDKGSARARGSARAKGSSGAKRPAGSKSGASPVSSDGTERVARTNAARPSAARERGLGLAPARRAGGHLPFERHDRPLGRPSPAATDPEVATRVETIDETVPGGRVIRARLGRLAPRVDRSVFGAPSGRRASAGRVLGVGLLCFAIWTLFDANQLYHNALSSPFGARRTVAVTILRPIASVTNFFGLSGPVNAANSALGRAAPSASTPLPTIPPSVAATSGRPSSGVSPIPGSHLRPSSGPYANSLTPGVSSANWPPPVLQPTTAHPLVLLDIGDSIGEDLGTGLGDLFSGDQYVRVIQAGKIDTGLARPDYYNWPVELALELRRYHPGAVVVMMGANDNQTLTLANGSGVPVSSPEWNTAYRQRIATIMEEATDSGAHLLWVGLPPLDSAAANSAFAERVNSMAEQEAAAHRGVTYVSSWDLLAGPKGTFVQYKTVDGSIMQIRYSDGVHLAPSGWDLLASYILGPMEQAWHVDLHATQLIRVG
jgi:hypothetical protein